MSTLRTFAVLGLLGMFAAAGAAEPEAEAPAVDAKQIEQWIADLDSDSFNIRQEASRKLVKAGNSAVPAVLKAAQGDSLEKATRAIGVLKELLKNEKTAAPAKEALEKLTKNDNRSVARRAAAALKPKEPAAEDPQQVIPGPGGIQIQIQGGGAARVIQLQARAVGGGQKNIQVQEDGKKISIQQDGKGINMTVTEKVNGKEKTSTYKAKDEDELKKKHPQAYKLFKKYAAGPAANPLRNLKIQPFQIPGLPARIRRAGDNQIAKDLERAQKELSEAVEQIEKLAKGTAGDELKSVLKKLQQTRKALEEAQKRAAK